MTKNLAQTVLPTFCLALAWFLSGTTKAADQNQSGQLHRPTALVELADGRLCVANQRSGTVSLIDVRREHTVAEVSVGRRLSDLAILPDGRHLLVTDEQCHHLILLKCDGDQLNVVNRLKVSPYPVSIQVSHDATRCFVASLWSRSLTIVDLANAGNTATEPTDEAVTSMAVSRTVTLPFEPREQLYLAEHHKLLVADAFGGHMAMLDTGDGAIDSVREIPGHNVRGLALERDGRHVLVSQQILNPLAPPTKSNIIWSVLFANCLRRLSVEQLLDPSADVMKDSRFIPLGTAGNGAGDPAGVTVDSEGWIFVALGGVNQLAILSPGGYYERRADVGSRPVAVLVARDEKKSIYVANHLSDSISTIDYTLVSQHNYQATATISERSAGAYASRRDLYREVDVASQEIPLGPPSKLSAADRGELLFYDARLSHDHWFSCHSCHSDGHSSGELADTLGDGDYGAPKRVLSLLGVADTGPWAWNGSMVKLRDQIHRSMETSMQGGPLSDQQTDDMVAFLGTLKPPPPANEGTHDAVLSSRIRRGQELFVSQGCAECHAGPTLTSVDVYDVGLVDEAGRGQFNPPSLRGVEHRRRFFHDGRASRLEDIFTKHMHQTEGTLSDESLSDLAAFLRSQ